MIFNNLIAKVGINTIRIFHMAIIFTSVYIIYHIFNCVINGWCSEFTFNVYKKGIVQIIFLKYNYLFLFTPIGKI